MKHPLLRPFSVVTLNIWNRGDPWDERLPLIREGLGALQPDVVALQEVLRIDEHGFDQAALIAEGLGYEVVYGYAPGNAYPFGNAILSRWPVLASDVTVLPRCDTDQHRCMVFAALASPYGTLPFVTTHLNWKLHEGHVRVAQIRAVVSRLTELSASCELPAVLAGDLNAETDSDEIRYLRGYTGLGGECVYFNDCFAAAGDGSSGATYSCKNPYAAVCYEPDRRIDYVFVRGPDERFMGVPLEARVCFDEPVNGVWPSDHFGVWARIGV
jgi:endonuclease/exonuclease/phosphatase family metal-dependent hydrolase